MKGGVRIILALFIAVARSEIHSSGPSAGSTQDKEKVVCAGRNCDRIETDVGLNILQVNTVQKKGPDREDSRKVASKVQIGVDSTVREDAMMKSKVMHESNSGPVFKTTTITFNDEAFKSTMYTEICPKAASYMVECYRREVDGKCEEYMKFENQAQFEQYIRNDFFWASKALLDSFRESATYTGYSDMNEDQFLNEKKDAEKVIAACKEPFPFPKPDNNKICYRDLNWATYLRLGYWGKDNCVCGDQICEKEAGAALAATQEPWRSAWQSSCTVTQCPL